MIVEIATRSTAARAAPGDWQRILRQWWEQLSRLRRRGPRRLRLAESLALGERRFVAVVEFERSRFLIGGTSGSVVLLAQLADIMDAPVSPGTLEPARRTAGENP